MRFLQRIADTRMGRSKHTIPRPTQLRSVQFKFHQFIHILQRHHITIQLYHSLILDEREGCELAPAVVESSIVAVVFVC